MKKKSFFALTISSALLLSSTAAFAEASSTSTKINTSIQDTNDDVSILKDNTSQIVVKEVKEDGITIAKKDKTTNTLTIEKYDVTGDELISTESFDLNELEASALEAQKAQSEPLPIQLQKSNMGLQSAAASKTTMSYQNTFMNREYSISFFKDGKNNWRIRSDDRRKSVTENKSNRSNLSNFRSAVERVNSGELAVISAAGFTTAVTILTVFLSGGLAAGIAVAGAGGTVATALYTVNSAVSDADYYYNRVR
ncbi:geobacillin-26 family protein [Exiguobacterium artemiae]|uniref:geobacillin-26 family protein n=1 Tax=Exiguobacterium artemiae TaxID=340145 RepID=UPI00047A8085|nr:geobacillin-26 family protein [Exiguobacterium sibiricum]